jgi:signal peptidase I
MSLPEPEGLTRAQLRSHRLALRLLIPLLLVLATIVTPLYVLYDVAKVDGTSMLPTLSSGEYMLITRGWKVPERGDVVVLKWSHDGITEEIVKRVIGLAGDTVAVEGDHFTVNGAQEAFPHEILAGPVRVRLTLVVPPNTVFVSGDNRAVSLDSRFIGPLPLSGIHGRVVAVWAPLDRMRVVPSP